MGPISFVVTLSLKICPNDALGLSPVCQSYIDTVQNFQQINQIIFLEPIKTDNESFLITNKYNKYMVSSKKNNNGWEVSISNNLDAPIGFYIDLNTKDIDLKKSFRIKAEYSTDIYEQIKAQDNPEVFKKLHAWNSTNYSYGIQFDSLSPKMIHEKENMSIFIWNPLENQTFSTPWFKNSITTRVDPGKNSFFKLDFFDLEDINMDRNVNSEDLTIVLNSWGTTNGDINGDGKTDAVDSGMVLSKWRESSNQ